MIKSILIAIVATLTIVGSTSVTRAQTGPASQAATMAAISSGVPLHTLAAQGNPYVTVERKGSLAHYNFHASHLPLPATKVAMLSGICCGFSYWTNTDELADWTGHVWSDTEWEDGVANGNNVYQWHNTCTPGGVGVAPVDCFYLFNGGGYPYWGMQFGDDICTGLVTQFVSFCIHHGQRRWIDDYGVPGTYYYW